MKTPVKTPSTTKLQIIWTSIAKLVVNTVNFVSGQSVNINSHFWSVTPNGYKHLFFVVDKIPFMPNLKGGMNANIFCSFVISKYNQDYGLIQHEMTHADQARRDGMFRFAWKMWKNSNYRFENEIEAYKVSMKFGMKPDRIAEFLMTPEFYHLDELQLTKSMIVEKLNE